MFILLEYTKSIVPTNCGVQHATQHKIQILQK